MQSCVCFNGFDFDGVVFLKAACSKSMHLERLMEISVQGGIPSFFATSKTID